MGLKQGKYPSTFLKKRCLLGGDGVLREYYRVFLGAPFLVLPVVLARVLAFGIQFFFCFIYIIF